MTRKNGKGRPSIGVTKKYSITLDNEDFYIFHQYLKQFNLSASQVLRTLIQDFIIKNKLYDKLHKK